MTVSGGSSSPKLDTSGSDDKFEHKNRFSADPTICTTEISCSPSMGVLHRSFCLIGRDSALSLQDPLRSCRDLAYSLWDPSRSRWDLARSHWDSAWSQQIQPNLNQIWWFSEKSGIVSKFSTSTEDQPVSDKVRPLESIPFTGWWRVQKWENRSYQVGSKLGTNSTRINLWTGLMIRMKMKHAWEH